MRGVRRLGWRLAWDGRSAVRTRPASALNAPPAGLDGPGVARLSSFAAASGMRVSEMNSEQSSAKMIEIPAWLSMIEICDSLSKSSGTKIIKVVDVAAITATLTSPAPSRAARSVDSPFSSLWKMDSSTTTALSTSMPAASIRPIIDRTLSVLPLK